ncbi:OR9G4 protein, partial [Oceanites oceanicus]|nr:OR9G4 protein [Oceanites oceanicus]
MADGNQTMMTEFILLGCTASPNLWAILLVLFLCVFLMALVRNIGMILLIQTDHLHIPMYFFISSLAFLDVTYSAIITSTALMTSIAETKAITFTGCAVQFFLFCVAGFCECYLLAGMAYPRFMAICNPLLYTNIMSMQFCVLPVFGSYTVSCINAITQTSVVFRLSFCHSNNVTHFCDAPPVLKLSCSDTLPKPGHLFIDIIHFTCSTVVAMSTILIILVSYTYIIIAILKIQSSKGRHKAFSTCASHLIAAMVSCETASFMYLWTSSKYSVNQDKFITVFYALANPVLNPLICLRNKEMKEAFRRTV